MEVESGGSCAKHQRRSSISRRSAPDGRQVNASSHDISYIWLFERNKDLLDTKYGELKYTLRSLFEFAPRVYHLSDPAKA